MDPRQQRSRARLHAAVLALAADRHVGDLTATAVAAEAGVHRSTLYEHASSPVDLLQAALLAELDLLRARLRDDLADAGPAPVATDVVARVVGEVTEGVLEHVARHAALYRRGLGPDSGAASLHGLLSAHFQESSRLLQRLVGAGVDVSVPGVADPVVADVATRFIADGTVGAIEGWLREPSLDVRRFLEVYRRLLPPWWPLTVSTPDVDGPEAVAED
ncbi:hypothetical protein [Nocardioides sp. Leaf374]|uniref:hypothetical protein n=1 Tax=Nocardioides sp. Leaf374 TaxID=2876560 RepID=UPI001E62E664|nr:hypothetical protein [Nocardioides sp. Leaf374]